MPYKDAKIYYDGGHFIAIPKEHYIRRRRTQVRAGKSDTEKKFDRLYEESIRSGINRRDYLIENMREDFADEKALTEFIDKNLLRKKINAIRRKVRLVRKIRLQDWNCFCTFTYDDKKQTEESFRRKLRDCLKHLASRKGWKYVGVWERSPEKQRLHFHGIFHIPEMIGELIAVKDYNTTARRIQKTAQNTHFLKVFGRNDFREIAIDREIMYAMRYIMKYMEKTGEKLVYSRGLPTYFISDIMDDDIVATIGAGDKKLLLFDNFNCFNEGCLIGEVSSETIEQLRKCN